MQKRTSYEFEGKVGYTYVTKAYGNSDVRFETLFRVRMMRILSIFRWMRTPLVVF